MDKLLPKWKGLKEMELRAVPEGLKMFRNGWYEHGDDKIWNENYMKNGLCKTPVHLSKCEVLRFIVLWYWDMKRIKKELIEIEPGIDNAEGKI